MSFIVDGTDWQFDGCSEEQIYEKIDGFLALVSISRERGETIWIGDDFQNRPMLRDLSLWALFGPDGPSVLSVEIQQELAAWLNNAPYYRDCLDGPIYSMISVDGEPEVENFDIAWAHHAVRYGLAVGCLSIERSGPLLTRSQDGEEVVFFVKTEENRLCFWRNAIEVHGDNETSLRQFAENAYPSLYFHGDVLNDVSQLVGGYWKVRNGVKYAFAILNDCGKWAFTFPPPALTMEETYVPDEMAQPTNQLIQYRFKGLNLEVAPENPNVSRTGMARRAREIQVDNETLYCHWHVKLEPHQNRIHIHKPVSVTDDKLVIGIIHRHLPLP